MTSLDDVDVRHLRAAIEAASSARAQGNHPFGAVLAGPAGERLLAVENTVVSDRDPTCHAELNLVRLAAHSYEPSYLSGCTLYASTEPCAMCAGGIFWSGIGRVVFALAGATLRDLVDDEESSLAAGCAEVLSRGGRRVEVIGPALESEAAVVHDGFWTL